MWNNSYPFSGSVTSSRSTPALEFFLFCFAGERASERAIRKSKLAMRRNCSMHSNHGKINAGRAQSESARQNKAKQKKTRALPWTAMT